MSNYRYNVPEVEDSVKDGALGKLNGTPNDSGDLIKNLFCIFPHVEAWGSLDLRWVRYRRCLCFAGF